MKRNFLIATVLGLVMIGMATAAWAYGGYGYGCRGGGCRGYGPCACSQGGVQNRYYDPGTVEKLHGKIVKVETVAGRGALGGIHLLVKTDKEVIPVHIGPQWYLDSRDVVFRTGERIEIRGSRITYDDAPAVIADRVVYGDRELKLRDSGGVPLWARRNRG